MLENTKSTSPSHDNTMMGCQRPNKNKNYFQNYFYSNFMRAMEEKKLEKT